MKITQGKWPIVFGLVAYLLYSLIVNQAFEIQIEGLPRQPSLEEKPLDDMVDNVTVVDNVTG